MDLWEKSIILENSSIMDAVKAIDESGMQIALIVDKDRKLKGILTDGDIRRAVLKGVDFSDKIDSIMKKNPAVARVGQSNAEIRDIMRSKQVHQIPIVDDEERVQNIVLFVDVIGKRRHDNYIVLMAGGLGTRLMPLTENVPKPLLKVGTKPILEIILESFIEKGFYNFFLSVNYRSEMIESYFGDGSKWDVNIRYIKEEKKLGTAGSLSLLPNIPDKPFIVMNGDILTKVDFSSLLSYHISENAIATMAVREYCSMIPYGVIKTNENIITSISEKPIEKYMVNAGIYVLNPSVVEIVKKNSYADMPGLFEMLIDMGNRTTVFPIREYWIDIGKMDDFKKAQTDYNMFWEGESNG